MLDSGPLSFFAFLLAKKENIWRFEILVLYRVEYTIGRVEFHIRLNFERLLLHPGERNPI
jgi:hypothetical protein